MGFFSKKKDSGQTAAPSVEVEPRDPKKAQRFFEHAKSVADTRNFDYSIDCYINGLRHGPDELKQHEALHEVAMRRHIGGGKPASMMDQLKHGGGKTLLDKMLNAEYLWAKDPFNLAYALSVMEAAAAMWKSDQATNGDLGEVAAWIGGIILLGHTQKRLDKKGYLKLKEIYSTLEMWDKAVDAMKMVVASEPSNMALVAELKNLEAERTLLAGRYGDEGGFRVSVRDEDKQRAIEQGESLSQSDASVDSEIQRARDLHKDAPEDVDRVVKLVRALLKKENDELENESIKLLQAALAQTGQYRFKVQSGDIKIRQFSRHLRMARKELLAQKEPQVIAALTERIKKLAEEQVKFELEEFGERVKNYPTDLPLRYQLGRRQFAAGLNDDAISSFQEAQIDPKTRPPALRYLGEAFFRKGWLNEAIDTFRRGIEIYPIADDRLGLELRYELVRSLEGKARKDHDAASASEAMKIASQIAQSDINYRDIRQCVDRIRKLGDEIKG